MPTASALTPLPNLICPVCGGPNACGPAASGSFDAACWCQTASFDPDALSRVPEAQRNQACICAVCAGVASKG